MITIHPAHRLYILNIARVGASRARHQQLGHVLPSPVDRWPGFTLQPTAACPGALPLGRPEEMVTRLQQAGWLVFETTQEDHQ